MGPPRWAALPAQGRSPAAGPSAPHASAPARVSAGGPASATRRGSWTAYRSSPDPDRVTAPASRGNTNRVTIYMPLVDIRWLHIECTPAGHRQSTVWTVARTIPRRPRALVIVPFPVGGVLGPDRAG